jgi:GTP:adenosylcobinamide-phosphate guanylyltransferase
MRILRRSWLDLKAVILAGGKGRRITIYKPFLVVCGRPLISWVYDSLIGLVDEIYLGIGYSHPLFSIFKNSIFKIFPTNDMNYVEDLVLLVKSLGVPLLILPTDVAFITQDILKRFIENCNADICNLKDSNNEFLGISYWKGLNFDNYADIIVLDKVYNINSWEDYIRANKECMSIEEVNNTLPI